MKNMKLGLKISIGFGLLIVISCVLGGMAVINMRSVETEAVRLAREYMPEVGVATSVERTALQTMGDMRLYSATEDKKYYESGLRNLAEVKRILTEAKALSDKYPDLVKLRENVAKTQTKIAEYEKLLQDTAARMDTMSRPVASTTPSRSASPSRPTPKSAPSATTLAARATVFSGITGSG